MASEFGFRPCKIEDLKGQPKVQKMLQIYIKAAQIKKESFPHTLHMLLRRMLVELLFLLPLLLLFWSWLDFS